MLHEGDWACILVVVHTTESTLTHQVTSVQEPLPHDTCGVAMPSRMISYRKSPETALDDRRDRLKDKIVVKWDAEGVDRSTGVER